MEYSLLGISLVILGVGINIVRSINKLNTNIKEIYKPSHSIDMRKVVLLKSARDDWNKNAHSFPDVKFLKLIEAVDAVVAQLPR